MSDRDELAQLAETIRSGSLGTSEIAAAILAAGYRKPWTVKTEAELDALPQGAVIIEMLGYAWQKMDSRWVSWLNPGESSEWMASGRRVPFTVLWEPLP